jgi:hypothetical protein
MICMVEMIIKQAERKIQEAERRIDIYYQIDRTGALSFLIKKEESTIDQLQEMINELSEGMRELA